MKKLLLFFTLLAMAIPLQAYGISSALCSSHEGGYVNAYNDVAIKADYKILTENAPAGGGIVKMGGQVTAVGRVNYANAGADVTVTPSPNWGWEASGLTVTDANGRDVVVTDNGDGSYSFTMPGADVTVHAGYNRLVGYLFEVVTSENDLVDGQTYLIVAQDRDKVMAYKSDEDTSYPVTDFEIVEWVGYVRTVIKVDDNACMFTMDNLKDTIVDHHPFKVAWLNTGNGFISESEAEDYNVVNLSNRSDNGRAIMQTLTTSLYHDAMEMRFRNRLLVDSLKRNPICYDYNGDQLIKIKTDLSQGRVWIYQPASFYNITTECDPGGSGFINLTGGDIDGRSQPGNTIQFHVGTYHGWHIKQVMIVNKKTGRQVAVNTENVSYDGNDYSFVMPASDVTISATYYKAEEPDLYMLGTMMNRTSWCASGPRFNYDIVNDEYFLDVYFKGTGDYGTNDTGTDEQYGYFCLAMEVDPNIAWQTAGANAGDWNQYVTGVLAPSQNEALVQAGNAEIQLYNDYPGNAFKIPAGVYRIKVDKDFARMSIENIPLQMTFDPASGSPVTLGQEVVIGSDLETVVHNITSQNDINDEIPQSIRNTTFGSGIIEDDNTALITHTGTTIVQAKAWLGQIVVNGEAEYTIGAPTGHHIQAVCDQQRGGAISLTGTAADGYEFDGRTVVFTVDVNLGFSLRSVTAVDGNGNTVAVTPIGDGTYSFIMPDNDVTVTAHHELVGMIFKLVIDTADITEGQYYTFVNARDAQVLNYISPDAASNHYSSTNIMGWLTDTASFDYDYVILDDRACLFSIEDFSQEYYSYRTGYLKTSGGYLGLDSVNAEFGYLALFESRDDVKKFTFNRPWYMSGGNTDVYYDYYGGHSRYSWELGYEPGIGFMMDKRPYYIYYTNLLYRYAGSCNITTVVNSEGAGTIELTSGVLGSTSAEGCQVIVTPVPGDGYALVSFEVTKDGDGGTVEVFSNLDGTFAFTMPGCDVTITANFDSGYKISKNCEPLEGGEIIVVPAACEGDTVKFDVIENLFYDFNDVVITIDGTEGQEVPVSEVDGLFCFVMPAGNVTIAATFDEEWTPLQRIESPDELNIYDGSQVKVTDQLIGTWAARNYLWAKDVSPADRSNFYLEKNADVIDFQRDVAELQYRDWDQSNWVMLDFSTIPELEGYSEKQLMAVMKKYVDQKIEGGSITGELNCVATRYTYDLYYGQEIRIRNIIRLNALPTIVKPATTGPSNSLGYPGFKNDQKEELGVYYSNPAARYAYNHYAPSNFIIPNTFSDGVYAQDLETFMPIEDERYFFMRPKDQEIVHVWGVWLGELEDYYDEILDETRTDEVFGLYGSNPYGFRGGFRIASWDFNVNQVDRNGDPTGYGYPKDDLVVGDVYMFHAAIQYCPVEIQEPEKMSNRELDWYDDDDVWLSTPQYYDVYPLDMVGTQQVFTDVKELLPHDAVTIESIRYYNIMGQESKTPFDGINIEVIRYKDGSMISHKVLK